MLLHELRFCCLPKVGVIARAALLVLPGSAYGEHMVLARGGGGRPTACTLRLTICPNVRVNVDSVTGAWIYPIILAQMPKVSGFIRISPHRPSCDRRRKDGKFLIGAQDSRPLD